MNIENKYTLKQIYLDGKKKLLENNIEDYQYEIQVLIEFVFGYDKNYLLVNPLKEIELNLAQKLFNLIEQRIKGVPLQYLVGKWSFGELDFYVGQGVLIPRDDTQVVINHCVEKIEKHNLTKPKNILDLCSGSGIIAITLSKKYKDANVYAVELSSKAFEYLNKNIEYNNAVNVKSKKLDVLKDSDKIANISKYDVIISNPPYIITDEIQTLQKEVLYEPIMALDGGEDGYIFYREIIKKYSYMLNKNGVIAFELGEGQYDYVFNLLQEKGFKDIDYMYDFGNCKRSICAVKD